MRLMSTNQIMGMNLRTSTKTAAALPPLANAAKVKKIQG